MWMSFFAAMMIACLVLYIPGIAFLSSAGMKNSYSVFLAPLSSIFTISVLGEIFAFTHQHVSLPFLWISAILVSLVAGFIFSGISKKEVEFPDIHPGVCLLYVLAGMVTLFAVYITSVDSPEQFCQGVDMVHHINTIQAMQDSSIYSSLAQSMYMSSQDGIINPWTSGGFYPSAYHICVAFVATMADVSNAVAINAFNAVLCAIAYPLTMLAFMGYCFEDKKYLLAGGALFVCALPSFPWDYIVYGPLYPNLMGFSITMLEAVVFMKCFEKDLSKADRGFSIALFVIGGISLAFTHPSSIFYLAIFLMPYCLVLIDRYAFNDKDKSTQLKYKKRAKIGLLSVWVLFFIGLGLVLFAMSTYRSPAVALMPDVTPKPLRSQGNAVINLMGAVGGMLMLLTMLIFPVTGENPHYTAVFAILGAIMALCIAVLFWQIKEPALVAQREQIDAAAGVSDDDEELTAEGGKMPKPMFRSLIFILMSVFFWFFGYNAVTSAFSRYAEQELQGNFALVLMVCTVAAIVSYMPVGLIAQRIGRKRTILVGILFLGSSFFAGIFFHRVTPMLYFFFALAGVGWAFINVNSYPMVVELSKGSDVGKYTGYYYTVSMTAQIFTPILSNILMEHIGYRTLFPYAAFFVMASFVTMLFVRHGDAKPIAKKGLEALDVDD